MLVSTFMLMTGVLNLLESDMWRCWWWHNVSDLHLSSWPAEAAEPWGCVQLWVSAFVCVFVSWLVFVFVFLFARASEFSSHRAFRVCAGGGEGGALLPEQGGSRRSVGGGGVQDQQTLQRSLKTPTRPGQEQPPCGHLVQRGLRQRGDAGDD